jgi:hypothetical protein
MTLERPGIDRASKRFPATNPQASSPWLEVRAAKSSPSGAITSRLSGIKEMWRFLILQASFGENQWVNLHVDFDRALFV